MFKMFDQIRFYKVSTSKLNKLRENFRKGKYTPDIKYEEFSLQKHQQMVKEHAAEIRACKERTRVAMAAVNLEDAASLARLEANNKGKEATPKPVAGAAIMVNDVRVVSQMAATVHTVHPCTVAGSRVKQGDELVVLEAMKMTINMKAPSSGVIRDVYVQEGQLTKQGMVIVTITPDPEDDACVDAAKFDIGSLLAVRGSTKTRLNLQVSSLLAHYDAATCQKERVLLVAQVVHRVFDAIDALSTDDNIWDSKNTRDNVLRYVQANFWGGEQAQFSDMTAPLYGVPFVVTDNFAVKGFMNAKDQTEPATNTATCINKLLASGGIFIGKMSTAFDRSDQQLSKDSTPSAKAVALGIASFSLVVDTAGVARVAASLNNLVTLEPTPGLVSGHGLLRARKGRDCPSIIAWSATDAFKVLEIVKGAGEADAYMRQDAPFLDYLNIRDGLQYVRFGVPRRDHLAQHLKLFGSKSANVVLCKFYNFLDRVLRDKLGATVVELDFNPFEAAAKHTTIDTPVTQHELFKMRKVINGYFRHPSNQVASNINHGDDTLAGPDRFDFMITPSVGDAIVTNTKSKVKSIQNFRNLLDLSAITVPMAERTVGATISALAFSDAHLAAVADHIQQATDLKLCQVVHSGIKKILK